MYAIRTLPTMHMLIPCKNDFFLLGCMSERQKTYTLKAALPFEMKLVKRGNSELKTEIQLLPTQLCPNITAYMEFIISQC